MNSPRPGHFCSPIPIRKVGARTTGLLVMGCLLLGASAGAEAPSTLGRMGPPTPEMVMATAFNDAMAAFQAGDYATTASKLEGIVSKAGEGAQLESVYFTLGAAYFNLADYPKAKDTLKKYLTKYPQGARVMDATFSLAQASLQTNDYREAAAQFAKLAGVPQYHEQALFYGAVALKEDKRIDEAIKLLESLIQPEIRSSVGIRGATVLAGLYGEKKQTEKTVWVIGRILQRSDLVENLAQLNSMIVELGDNHLAAGRQAQAVAVYRMVRTRAQIIRFQDDRVTNLSKQFTDTVAAMRANRNEVPQYLSALSQLRTAIEEAKKMAEEAKQLPEFMPGVMLRMGRAYYDMGRPWESLVAYQEILARYPEAKERETVTYATMVNFAEANRPEAARQIGEQYLKEFPKGPNANTVGYLMGATALQSNDPQRAETYFGRMLKEQPDSSFKAEMIFLLGNAKFAQGKFEEAITEYLHYQKEFAKGAHTEDVVYRIAVGLVFAGKYEKAIPELEKYLHQYPKGAYAPDARYRLALCSYAASQYDEVIERCRKWEKDYGADPQLGEVLALLADSLAAKGQTVEAAELYIRSYKVATTEEVLNYSLFEAQKALQKKGDWVRIGAMFQEFVTEHPEHPIVPMAMFWIGKAKAREGKVEEAKQFLADTIKKYIDDPSRDAVEQMLSQLAQLCARKKRPAVPTEAPAAVATPAPGPVTAVIATPAPQEPAVDPGVELETLLGGGDSASPTKKARLLFVKGEVSLLRHKPEERKQQIETIVRNFQPSELSPMLLAEAGDQVLADGDLEKAASLFQYLMEQYPKSPMVDFAYGGLGEIAYRHKEYEKALRLFSDPIDGGNANQKLKDLTVGRGKTLLILKKLDEAQKIFEQVASVREWRGEATAQAVYSLGEIEFQRGNWAAANAYYQRVFVAYQKFLPWVAKAYLQSGQCFQKLGQKPEAAKTYQEMLRNEKLAKMEEAVVARQRLQTLGGGQG
ncbi:MAG: tetratricopeptide repeat protein [Chthoniobacter sp.]|nr:tetratricopeptide repeat protein [Chthoniobacter sp.]